MAELLLADAAVMLGVSVDTLRRRVKRQQIEARRDGSGRYWVTVPDVEPGEADSNAATVYTRGALPAAPATPASATADLVDHLRSEVAFLRQELQAQREQHRAEIVAWQERLREAHLLAIQRPTPLLEPGGAAAEGAALAMDAARTHYGLTPIVVDPPADPDSPTQSSPLSVESEAPTP